MEQEIRFSDYILVLTSDYDSILFNPVFSEIVGVYLYNDEKKPIKYILLDNSILTIYYLDGDIEILDKNIISVEVKDERFKRRVKSGINGSLFKYSSEEALYYNLDINMAFPKEIISNKKRKRSL